MELDQYMRLAINEAKISLREGNNGFGAVMIHDGRIIASSHDMEETKNDPTSHAELHVIKEASKKLGKSLAGCILVSTHEPCPMCATAVVWSGISEIAYGFSIKEAMKQGRKRIELTCTEIFERANVNIKIQEGILKEECSVLYRKDVRVEIEKLRDADDRTLFELNTDSMNRRVKWYEENKDTFGFINHEDILGSGYELLLKRFGITQNEAPIVKKTNREIVFHSKNFCPTLEACKILGLDTREICKKLNENATEMLVKQVDKRLMFTRNYEKLRPYSEYCEEKICIEE